MQIVYAYKNAAVSVDCEGPVSPFVPRFALRAFAGVEADLLLPNDRVYLSLFYDYLAQMVQKDATRKNPVFETMDNFAALHCRSLSASPAAYCPRLMASIDIALVGFLGLGAEMNHAAVFAACRALAWRFAIHGDD